MKAKYVGTVSKFYLFQNMGIIGSEQMGIAPIIFIEATSWEDANEEFKAEGFEPQTEKSPSWTREFLWSKASS